MRGVAWNHFLSTTLEIDRKDSADRRSIQTVCPSPHCLVLFDAIFFSFFFQLGPLNWLRVATLSCNILLFYDSFFRYKKLISGSHRRKLLANSSYCLKHANVVKLSRNFRLSHRRIATFSAHREFLIIALNKYSYLLTYLLTYSLITFLLITMAFLWNNIYKPRGEKIFIRDLECYKETQTESLRRYNTNRWTEKRQRKVQK